VVNGKNVQGCVDEAMPVCKPARSNTEATMSKDILAALKAEHDKLNAVIEDARRKQHALKTAAATIAGDAKAPAQRLCRKYSAAEVGAIQEQFDAGATVKEVAEKHDIQTNLIYRWIHTGKLKRPLLTPRETTAIARAAVAAKNASAA